MNLIEALAESMTIVNAMSGLPPVTTADLDRLAPVDMSDTLNVDEGDWEARHGRPPFWH